MRRASWILWLMLALLPLRGWAVAGMGLPQGTMSSDVVLQGSVTPSTAPQAAMPPCHQAPPGDGASPAGPACQACDACHAAMASAPCAATTASMPSPCQPPAVKAERDTGRTGVGGLERPPRADLT